MSDAHSTVSTEPAILTLGATRHELPVVVGSEGERAIDIRDLRARTGHITLDPGYGNTGSCESAITFIHRLCLHGPAGLTSRPPAATSRRLPRPPSRHPSAPLRKSRYRLQLCCPLGIGGRGRYRTDCESVFDTDSDTDPDRERKRSSSFRSAALGDRLQVQVPLGGAAITMAMCRIVGLDG